MPTGISTGDNYANAPTVLPGFGDLQWESMSGRDTSRAMVGGDTWGEDMTGFNPSTGFNRIQTGNIPSGPVPGAAGARVTDWRNALNPQSPTFWIMLFTLAAVGFIHARVNLHAGPAYIGASAGRGGVRGGAGVGL